MCASVAQLVRANVGRCGPYTRHMVPCLNFDSDDTLIYLVQVVAGAVSTPRFGFPWRVLRAWPWKAPRLSKYTHTHTHRDKKEYENEIIS